MSPAEQRAVVVGGGVIGTWHALDLVRAGFAVDHLEADAAPVGASVRNFGLVWVSGRRSGEELEAARRSRRRWEEVAAEVPGIGFRPMTSLTVAGRETERAVMEAFARHPDAAARGITFLEPEEVKACNPAVAGDVAGALHGTDDAVVEPRHVPSALQRHLTHTAPERYQFHRGRRVVALEAHAAVDARGRRWTGEYVVVATGASYDQLPGTGAQATGLRRVRLQMLETAPLSARLTTSLADADTLRYYPAYEAAPLADLGQQIPVAAQHHLQLLVVQRPDGALTIGDTHAYEEPFDFALDEEPSHELLDRTAKILGTPVPAVRRRWAGVYAQCRDGRLCLREEIHPGVLLVTGAGGRGMTCAPAIAADTLEAAGITGTASSAASPSAPRDS